MILKTLRSDTFLDFISVLLFQEKKLRMALQSFLQEDPMVKLKSHLSSGSHLPCKKFISTELSLSLILKMLRQFKHKIKLILRQTKSIGLELSLSGKQL